MLPPSGPL
jgi:hypothetical protein